VQVSNGADVMLTSTPTCVLLAMVQHFMLADHMSAWVARPALGLLSAEAATQILCDGVAECNSLCDIERVEDDDTGLGNCAGKFALLLEKSHLLLQPEKDVVQLLGLWVQSFFQQGESSSELEIMSWLGLLLCRRKE
jgi:hypothetical protein